METTSITNDFWSSVQKNTTRVDYERGQRYPTGLGAVDEIFSDAHGKGLKAGIYLLVGDPGCGKSSFALQVMHRLISNGHPGAYLAFEGKNNVFDCIDRIGLSHIIPVVDQTDGWLPNSATLSALIKQGNIANTTDKPAVYCIDSAKNLNEGSLKGRRDAIKELMAAVMSTNSIVFLVGHVSKESRGKADKKIQGPSELEELIDARIDFVSMEPAKKGKKRIEIKDLIDEQLTRFYHELLPAQGKVLNKQNLELVTAKINECHAVAGKILAGEAVRKGKLEHASLEGRAVEMVQSIVATWAASNGGHTRHMGVDTSSKNRLGRPGDFWQFYLTENGWLIPDTAIETGAKEEDVYWHHGVHVSVAKPA